jgi:7-carboxy-7-deazaguanine synthase
MTLIVNEIFYSIQGESLNSGRPCVFVRLTGCNLRCSYCDTGYAYEDGNEMEIGAIIDQVSAYHCTLVELTGGEPLLQEETPMLIDTLIKNNYEMMMETNGTLDIDRVSNKCMRIVDIKCPSSGEARNNDYRNIEKLTKRDQLKFVIGSHEDYMFAKDIVSSKCKTIKPDHLLFSPVSDILKPDILAGWILRDHLNGRLHLQLHRIIWPDISRGV